MNGYMKPEGVVLSWRSKSKVGRDHEMSECEHRNTGMNAIQVRRVDDSHINQ